MEMKRSAKKYAKKQMGSLWTTQFIKLCPNSVLTNYVMNLLLKSKFWLKL